MPTKLNAFEPDPLEVGARIRALRHEAGLSQSGLAALIDVSSGAVGNWEQGQSLPSVKQMSHLCAKMNVTLDFIYWGTISELAPGRAQTLSRLGELKHDPTGPNLGQNNL